MPIGESSLSLRQLSINILRGTFDGERKRERDSAEHPHSKGNRKRKFARATATGRIWDWDSDSVGSRETRHARISRTEETFDDAELLFTPDPTEPIPSSDVPRTARSRGSGPSETTCQRNRVCPSRRFDRRTDRFPSSSHPLSLFLSLTHSFPLLNS